MKFYKFIFSLLFVALVFLSCSTSDDFRLSRSVFIADADFPGLPIYSELGYNTFGVYFDRTPFTSDEYLVPLKVVAESDTCRFIFTGRFKGDNEETTLTFHVADFLPKKHADLLTLNNTKRELTADGGVFVTFRKDKDTDTLRVTNGELNFKRVQKMLVDKEEVKTVLSGTFSLRANIGNVPVSINNGRFDVGVDEQNFFSTVKMP